MASDDWKKIAAEKRDSVLALIPDEWRIPSPPSAAEQRDVTGKYIRQYLNEEELEITETDAVGIVRNTTSGKWSCVSVTKAFCHRAAIAHQLVRFFESSSVGRNTWLAHTFGR
jgi:amidase